MIFSQHFQNSVVFVLISLLQIGDLAVLSTLSLEDIFLIASRYFLVKMNKYYDKTLSNSENYIKLILLSSVLWYSTINKLPQNSDNSLKVCDILDSRPKS